jgi:hypothetical protein
MRSRSRIKSRFSHGRSRRLRRSPRFLVREAKSLHAVATAYGVRPSDLLAGDWTAYQVDVAVLAQANAAAKPAPAANGAAAFMAAFPGYVRKVSAS